MDTTFKYLAVVFMLAAAGRVEGRTLLRASAGEELTEGLRSQTVSVPLYLDLDGVPTGVVQAVQLRMAVESDGVTIDAVDIDEAFPLQIDGQGVSEDRKGLSLVRSRALVGSKPRLVSEEETGAPFATVDIDLGDNQPDEIVIRVESSVVLLGRRQGSVRRKSTVTIRKGRDEAWILDEFADVGRGRERPRPWTQESLPIHLEVQPLGGGTPLRGIVEGETYELHYSADVDWTDGYVLFSVSDSVNQQLEAADPPIDGPWASEDSFFADLELQLDDAVAEVPGLPIGNYRRDLITAMVEPDSDLVGRGEGYLFDFTPNGRGLMYFEMVMWSVDESNRHFVNMESLTPIFVSAAPRE